LHALLWHQVLPWFTKYEHFRIKSDMNEPLKFRIAHGEPTGDLGTNSSAATNAILLCRVSNQPINQVMAILATPETVGLKLYPVIMSSIKQRMLPFLSSSSLHFLRQCPWASDAYIVLHHLLSVASSNAEWWLTSWRLAPQRSTILSTHALYVWAWAYLLRNHYSISPLAFCSVAAILISDFIHLCG